jgi:hypothetical protein
MLMEQKSRLMAVKLSKYLDYMKIPKINIKKTGLVLFMFFLFKGIAWLLVGYFGISYFF